MIRRTLRHVATSLLLLVAMLCQETWALAGTTGGMQGTVVDAETGAPVAGAAVKASSPSTTLSTNTDAAGRFTFISLVPDTYTVGVDKEGFTSASEPGVVVFADSTAQVAVRMNKSLKTIANVTSRAASNLVHPGTTSDVYSVNAATQDKVSALGGGGSLNSAYSAVASVPGAVMPLNQTGYFQTVQIRGGDYDQVGYELDGVPVNRSFDNYPSGALSSLGNQELQVYTGATPADSQGQGLAGYINQVIKTGTYPGYGNISAGIGTPTFYHKLSAEAGGANPSRTFSYYVGIGGYNQDWRYVNNSNGSEYQSVSPAFLPDSCPSTPSINIAACYASGVGPGGYQLAPFNWSNLSSIADRDVIANFHFAIPHKNDGGRDDIQVLWDSGQLLNSFYESTNDAGGVNAYGGPGNQPFYIDGFNWSGPVGQVVPAANLSQYVSPYLYPSQPSHAFFGNTLVNGTAPGFIDPTARDTIWNNQEVVKLQYQKNIGTNAFVRLYGYSYYSDWLQNGPVCAFSDYGCAVSPDYELSSHTRGASLEFSDQLNAQNLLTFQANYTTASSVRDNNTQMFNSVSASRGRFAVLVDPNNPTSGVCYQAPTSGTAATPVSCQGGAATWLQWSDAYAAQQGVTPITNYSGDTCGTGACSYFVAENSKYATYNSVVPKFTALSLTDEWRPTDKLLLNVGIREDRFEFDGSNTFPNDPARQFWLNAFNTDNCVQNTTGKPIDKVSGLGLASPTAACPAGYSVPVLSLESNQVEQYNVFQPRVSGTYTIDPNSVLRFSYGRYVEPPNTAYEQYNTLQSNLAGFLGNNFYQYGFTTPGHNVVPPTSNNYDLSWEHRLKGTDWSFKVTPFLRKTQNQIQNFFLDQATGFISGLNVGRQTSEGVELQLNKGDFARNGISGSLAFTYTNSYIQYDDLQNGTTIVSQINQDIANYNSYTSFCSSHAGDSRCANGSQLGAAAPCYTSAGAPDAACGAGSIANPYWNAPVQALLNPTANYPTYDIFPGGIGGSAQSFSIPYAATLILNYKHDKFAITPSFQMLAGSRYGSPESMAGIDPAAGGCTALAGSVTNDPRYPYGASGGSPYNALNCSGTIPVPDSFTGHFDNPGAFLQPTAFVMNLQLSYDLSPRVSLVGTIANLVNSCFGGTKTSWTFNNDANVCSYGINNSAGVIPPDANVYNPGASFQRLVQYPYGAYLGGVNVDGNSTKTPLQFYIEGRIKI